MKTERLLRIGTAAAVLGVSVDTLRRYETERLFTYQRRAGIRYVTDSQLHEIDQYRKTIVRGYRRRATGSHVE